MKCYLKSIGLESITTKYKNIPCNVLEELFDFLTYVKVLIVSWVISSERGRKHNINEWK